MNRDPFLAASPTYIAAQRTNQSKGHGYGFFPDDPMKDSPIWIKALEEAFRPRSLFIFAVIAAVVSLWWL